MKRSHRAVRRCLAVSAFVVAAGPCVAFAETPGEIPKPWTYEGSMKLQEQERQRDQQYQQQAQPQGGARTVPGGNAGGAAAAASAAAAAPTHELDRVEYRGDAKHVVVLPKATVKLMEFDVEGSNRIDWKSQNSVLVKVGTTAAASDAAPRLARAAPAPAPPTNPAGALLLSVGATSSSDKIACRKLLVLKADPQIVLVAGGLASTTHGTPLQTWMRACQQRTQACQQGAMALKAYTVGIATTDATGHARSPHESAVRSGWRAIPA